MTYILGYILVLALCAVRRASPDGNQPARTKPQNWKWNCPAATRRTERRGQARLPEIPGAQPIAVDAAAGRSVGEIEKQIGSRVVIERIVRNGEDVEPTARCEIAGRRRNPARGPDRGDHRRRDRCSVRRSTGEHLMRTISRRTRWTSSCRPVTCTAGHCRRSLIASATRRGVFLRSLTRQGREVPITPATRIYIGDIMTLVGASDDIKRHRSRKSGNASTRDRTDIAFLAIRSRGRPGWLVC